MRVHYFGNPEQGLGLLEGVEAELKSPLEKFVETVVDSGLFTGMSLAGRIPQLDVDTVMHIANPPLEGPRVGKDVVDISVYHLGYGSRNPQTIADILSRVMKIEGRDISPDNLRDVRFDKEGESCECCVPAYGLCFDARYGFLVGDLDTTWEVSAFWNQGPHYSYPRVELRICRGTNGVYVFDIKVKATGAAEAGISTRKLHGLAERLAEVLPTAETTLINHRWAGRSSEIIRRGYDWNYGNPRILNEKEVAKREQLLSGLGRHGRLMAKYQAANRIDPRSETGTRMYENLEEIIRAGITPKKLAVGLAILLTEAEECNLYYDPETISHLVAERVVNVANRVADFLTPDILVFLEPGMSVNISNKWRNLLLGAYYSWAENTPKSSYSLSANK